MSFWKIIGEIILFRWLFKSDGHREDKNDSTISDNSRYGQRCRFDPGDYHSSYDRFHEEQDDYDMMDDF